MFRETFNVLPTTQDTFSPDFIFKKAMQRLFLLRKLRSFGVSESVLENVYKSLVQSLLSFNITAWFGNLSVKNRNKLARVVNTAGKIIGRPQDQLTEVYNISVHRKALAIVADATHPLHSQFEKLHSGRRFKVPVCRKNSYRKSFLPTAVTVLNSRH